MTISSETNRSGPYSCNGATTSFAYGFKVYDEAHLSVILTNSAGVETILTLGTHYTVTGVGADAGGSIVTVATYATGNKITILLDVPFEQETDLENQGAYYAETIERALDLLTQQSLQLKELISRSVVLPVTETISVDELTGYIIALSAIQAQLLTLAGIADDISTVAGISAEVVSAEGYATTATTKAAEAAASAAAAAASAIEAMAGSVSDGGITTVKLAANAVTAAKMALGAWTDVASASTVDLGAQASRNIYITGTATIASFGANGPTDNLPFIVGFSGTLTLTHSASLFLPGAADIVTEAGDIALVVHYGSSSWQVIGYLRASMAPGFETRASAEAGTGTTKAMNALRVAQAIDALAYEVGVGQTLQNMTGSRAFNVVYQNTTGKPITVFVATAPTGSSSGIEVYIGQTSTPTRVEINNNPAAGQYISARVVVPSGWYYKFNTDSATGTTFYELR